MIIGDLCYLRTGEPLIDRLLRDIATPELLLLVIHEAETTLYKKFG